MKKFRILIFAAVLFSALMGCADMPAAYTGSRDGETYTVTYLNLFDTVTTIMGSAESEEAFQTAAQDIYDRLEEYHQLFDIYHEYEGMANLKTVNDQAGIAPVQVDAEIIELLADCRAYFELTDGKVNVAMGSVLSLWHDARNHALDNPESAKLPEWETLQKAGAHMDFEAVEINKADSSVYISDAQVQLDVGAVAKGWAVQRAAKDAPPGFLISVGGNVCVTGPKTAEGNPWVIGIEDYNGSSDYLHTINLSDGCVVTSGDYQRNYVVDGEVYHHIIDPATLYPANYWHMVTVTCEDSGIADMLSTALFLLPREEGQKLLEQFEAEAMWVDIDGVIYYSPGFENLIRR